MDLDYTGKVNLDSRNLGNFLKRVCFLGKGFEVIREGETFRDGSLTTRYAPDGRIKRSGGNRASKATAWGTIRYEYDAENLLVRRGDMVYTHDKDGNVLSEAGLRYRAE
jgi:hypothetical protein